MQAWAVTGQSVPDRSTTASTAVPMLPEELRAVHPAILSTSNITSLLDIILSSIFEMPFTDGVEADLQPDSDVGPNPFTGNKTAIRVVAKQL